MTRRQVYRTPRSLLLQLDHDGSLLARASVTSRPVDLPLDTLPILQAFARPGTVAAALADLAEAFDVDAATVRETVEALAGYGLLVPVAEGDAAGPSRAFEVSFGDWAHVDLLTDGPRVHAYREAIARHVRGRRVVEIGCGTGILSVLAARAGAAHVIAIEEGPIADVAEEVFRESGCADRVELIRANSMDVDLDEPADVIVHEILGDSVLDENVLPYVADARARLLRPGGRLIPGGLRVACVGLAACAEPPLRHPRWLREDVRRAAEAHGVALDPVARMLSTAPRRVLVSPLRAPGTFALPPVLGPECVLLDLDLHADLEPLLRPREVRLRASADGDLGGVLLYFRARMDETLELTNDPAGPATSWSWDVRLFPEVTRVRAGDEVALSVAIDMEAGEQALVVRPGRPGSGA